MLENMQDVSFGEVWVCSGQSNMEFNMGGILDAELQSDISSKYTQVASRPSSSCLSYDRDHYAVFSRCGTPSPAW